MIYKDDPVPINYQKTSREENEDKILSYGVLWETK